MSTLTVAIALSTGLACSSPGSELDFTRPDARPTIAPTHLEFAMLSELSRSDPGWSGTIHGIGPPGGSIATVEVTECDDELRRCRFRGPVRGDEPIVSQRCVNDVSLTCAADEDCGDGGRCRHMFPPIQDSNQPPNPPTCQVVYFEPVGPDDPMASYGVIDLWTGDIDYSVLNIRAGISLAGVCQNCLGDAEPRDGSADGHCGDTEIASDVAGTSTDPPASTSFDCESKFEDLELAIPAGGASTTPLRWTLDDSRPKCTVSPFTALDCWCGVCEGSATACASDAECGEGGVCGWNGGGTGEPIYKVKPDACVDACAWDEVLQKGTCVDAVGNTVGCFPRTGSMEVRGSAEVRDGYYVSTLGLLTCMPATGNALLDSLSGFPGPLFYQTAYRITPLYP
jgi:hypothetical protein